MGAHGPTLHASSTPASLSRAADGSLTLWVKGADGKVVSHRGFDVVLCAIGRVPKTMKSLALADAGVRTNEKGYIIVDE